MDTARPPASSKEELMREPLESLLRLRWRFTLVLLSPNKSPKKILKY
jgi:hypothetical protein